MILSPTVRYIGSKTALLPALTNLVSRHAVGGTFCDAFGGLGIVGSHFKTLGFRVWSGDVLRFAHFFQLSRIGISRKPSFRRLASRVIGGSSDVERHLNEIDGEDGWFAREYSRKRKFFSGSNARRIAACQRQIEQWHRAQKTTSTEHAFLVASLIDSADRVANTAGTYYAHLKALYRKAKKPFVFQMLNPVPGQRGHCALMDARQLVRSQYYDVVYLDPPYNDRSYAHYYHLPETMAGGCPAAVHGASGMPDHLPAPSDFNRPRLATGALLTLIREARCGLLVLHYSSIGLVAHNTLFRELRRFGAVERYELSAPGYTTAHQCRQSKHIVYLARHG